ncbi:hypothetical protein [Streptomyces sp. NPDC001880]
MTTAFKPLADHGTTARAKGRPASGLKGCPCRPCRDAENAYDKRRRFLNETGRSVRVEAAEATAHLKELFEAGAGWNQLVAVTGCSSSTLVAIVHNQRTSISRRVSNKILAVDVSDVLPPRRRVSAIGSIRRCRALIATGHSCLDIAAASPLDPATIRYLVNGRPETVSAPTADGVMAAYTTLSNRRGTCQRSLNRAARERWAPTAAWDDERIDDPAAVADWTGVCGTDRGWWMHTLQKLPMCEPCRTAHEEWKAQHRGLPRGEFQVALMASRASASSRGADIATDARELMRLGCDYEQAAARLGVTRQHLQQELHRHPETDGAQAAA